VVESNLPRGMVTFLFTDIEGSTRLAQVLGDGYLPVLSEHRQLLRTTLTDAGGVELFTEGDSYFFAFADACAAVAACASAQRALADHSWSDPGTRPLVRMGLHTGRAEPHGREYASAEVHRAARVAFAAHGGQILLSAATVAEVGSVEVIDLGLHRLRGFDGRERLYQLTGAGLERNFPRPRTEGHSPHNLPCPVTSFVGRVAERAEVQRLLAAHRLVTVVGAGGSGKTRLATMVAAGLVDDPFYPDGVWHLDLVEVSDPGLVAFALSNVLGLRPEPGRPIVQTLVDHLDSRRMLLLLDTCEVLLAPALAMVGTILAGAPGVNVLATSREPLGQPGEVVWRIPSLSLAEPVPGAPSDAVALLAERTCAARGGHPVAQADLPHLARIASRLDGLPLALELAAARLRVLSALELDTRLHAELGDSDPLLALDAGHTGEAEGNPDRPRHATMQAAVNWSYRTLPTEAAKLLRWLSVFSGAIDLSTVECLVGRDPLHPLTILVDKSLVQVERPAGNDGGVVYRVLQPIRAFAARKLADAQEEGSARAKHASWALRELERTLQGADGRPVTLSLYSIDPLAPELRGALRWCGTGGSARQGLRIAIRLDQWWRERGLAREGRLWLYRLYARLAESGEPVPDAELARAFHVHALQAAADGEVAEELRFARRAEASARRAGDPGLLVRVLAARSAALRDAGKTQEAEQTCREVIAWADAHGVPADALFAIFHLAEMLWLRGSLDEAADILAAARPLEQTRPMERGRRTVDQLLGLVALSRGDLVAAHEHLTVSLRSRMSYGFHSRACVAIKAIAARCIHGGDFVTGVTLFGAAESATAMLHCGPGQLGPYWKQQQSAARVALGDNAFDEAYAHGTAMGLREAAAMALLVEHPDLAHDSVRFAEVA
jgi:predicted ATPase/class 3 adenylate cyclase